MELNGEKPIDILVEVVCGAEEIILEDCGQVDYLLKELRGIRGLEDIDIEELDTCRLILPGNISSNILEVSWFTLTPCGNIEHVFKVLLAILGTPDGFHLLKLSSVDGEITLRHYFFRDVEETTRFLEEFRECSRVFTYSLSKDKELGVDTRCSEALF